MEILLILVAFCFGVSAGTFGVLYLKSKVTYSGTINVLQGPDTTTYSLELNYEPEKLETIRVATFEVKPAVKVDSNLNPLK